MVRKNKGFPKGGYIGIEEAIIEHLKKNPYSALIDVQKAIGVDLGTTRKYAYRMLNEGKLVDRWKGTCHEFALKKG